MNPYLAVIKELQTLQLQQHIYETCVKDVIYSSKTPKGSRLITKKVYLTISNFDNWGDLPTGSNFWMAVFRKRKRQ